MKSKLTFSRAAVFPLITALSVIVFGTSCQKSSVTENLSSDNSFNQQKLDITNTLIEASGIDEENFDMVMENDEYTDAPNVSNAKVAGKIVTYSPSKDVYPHTKTIDFGAGFTNPKGVTKSGKVMITYYDAATDPQGKFTLTTYDNYYIDGVHIEGSIQVNRVKNSAGKFVYLHIISKKVSDAAGDVKEYNSNATWTVIDWQGGKNNAYEITAHATGNETYNGIEANNFQTDVDDAKHIIKPFDCKRVQGGLLAEIHLAKGKVKDLTEYLDYGNGDCDDIATLSVNGAPSGEVTLPLRFWPLNL